MNTTILLILAGYGLLQTLCLVFVCMLFTSVLLKSNEQLATFVYNLLLCTSALTPASRRATRNSVDLSAQGTTKVTTVTETVSPSLPDRATV